MLQCPERCVHDHQISPSVWVGSNPHKANAKTCSSELLTIPSPEQLLATTLQSGVRGEWPDYSYGLTRGHAFNAQLSFMRHRNAPHNFEGSSFLCICVAWVQSCPRFQGSSRKERSPGFTCLTTRAGFPTATLQAGTSLVITAPAPRMQPSPIVTPPASRHLRCCLVEHEQLACLMLGKKTI